MIVDAKTLSRCNFERADYMNLQWRVEGDTLIISGNGNMENYSFGLFGGKAPWNSQRKSVKKIVIESGVTSIGNRAFDDYKNMTSITIPEGITSIGESAFNNCKSLTAITLPSSVLSIGDYAFDDCHELKSVNLSEELRTIGQSAFNDCKSLTEITLPKNLIEIADKTFDSCKNLKTVNFPSRLKAIGEYAFWQCESLREIILPEGLVSIGEDAFWNCKSLVEVKIPVSVQSVGKKVFGLCANLKRIYYAGSVDNEKNLLKDNKAQIIRYSPTPAPKAEPVKVESKIVPTPAQIKLETPPEVVTKIHWKFVGNTLTISGNGDIENYSDENKSPWLIADKTIEKVVIESGVTSIGDNAFKGCWDLKSADISETVKSIGNNAFDDCRKLELINLPKKLSSIGDNAFHNCLSLTDIVIPAGVNSVGNNIFSECIKLQKIYHKYDDLRLARKLREGNNANLEYYENPPVIMPRKSAVEITPARISTPSIKIEIAPKVEDDIHWKLEGDTLRIFGTGKMNDNEPMQQERWIKRRGEIKKLAIESGITHIGNYAFFGCYNLNSLTIADTVISIGKNAFDSCRSLTRVSLPKNITAIGDCVFRDCSDLKEIVIPKNEPPFDGRLVQRNSARLICYTSSFAPTPTIHITNIGKKSALGDIVFIANYGCDNLGNLNYTWSDSSDTCPYKIVHSPANDGIFRKLMEDYKSRNKSFDVFFNEFTDIMKANRMRISRIPGSALAQAEIKFCNDTKGLVWDTIFSAHNITHFWVFDAVKYWYEKQGGLNELRGKSLDVFNPLNILRGYNIQELVLTNSPRQKSGDSAIINQCLKIKV